MTTTEIKAMGIQVQITGPDNVGYDDCCGLAGTIVDYDPDSDHGLYRIAYYKADLRMASARWFPASSIELIDDVS